MFISAQHITRKHRVCSVYTFLHGFLGLLYVPILFFFPVNPTENVEEEEEEEASLSTISQAHPF